MADSLDEGVRVEHHIAIFIGEEGLENVVGSERPTNAEHVWLLRAPAFGLDIPWPEGMNLQQALVWAKERMPHDEHVLLLAICEWEPNSPQRLEMYERLAGLRSYGAVEANLRDFWDRRGFLTSKDWRVAELTQAGKDRLAAERVILRTRTP